MSIPKIIHQLKEKNPQLNKSELTTIVNIFFESILKALSMGKAVEIRNFGRFSCKILQENYKIRNPKTNELIYKPKRVKIKFKASENLKKLINL